MIILLRLDGGALTPVQWHWQQRFMQIWCQIFTDVDGVYTADPRIIPNAQKLDEITYDEMLELASLGANVLHIIASVEMAKKYNVNPWEWFPVWSETRYQGVKRDVTDGERC